MAGKSAILAVKILADSKDAVAGMDTVEARTGKLQGALGILGKGLAIGVAAIGTGVVAAAKGLYEVGATFDEVTDTIRVGTGASGKALDDLVGIAKTVGSDVPNSFSEVGSTVADLNTRLGLTGDTLGTVSKQFIEAGNITGEALDIGTVTAGLQAFGIQGKDTETAMDSLFRVSQATGVGMNELSSSVTKTAPALQQLGLSFADSAALAGSLDKAGLDATAVMSSMSKGLVTLAKDGEQPKQAFTRVTGEIDQFIKKGDTAGALNLAGKVFGTKGAQQMVKALQDGTLNLNDLQGAAGVTGDTILGLGESTRDLPEHWKVFKNTAMAALEPVGTKVFAFAGDTLGAITEKLQTIDFSVIGAKFSAFTSGAGAIFSTLGAAIQPALQAIMPTLTTFGTMIGGVFTALAPSIAALAPQFLQLVTSVSPLSLIMQVLQPLLPQIGAALTQLGGALTTGIATILPVIIGVVQTIIPILSNLISTLLPPILQIITALIPVFAQLITSILPPLAAVFLVAVSAIAKILPPIISIATTIVSLLVPVITALMPVVVTVFEGIAKVIEAAIKIVTGIIDVFIGLFTGNWGMFWGGIEKIFTGFWDSITAVFGTIGAVFGQLWDAGLRAVSGVVSAAVSAITGYFTGLWDDITGKFSSIGEVFGGLWSSGLSAVGGAVTAGLSSITGFFSSAWNDLTGGVSKAVGDVQKFFSDLPSKILGALQGFSLYDVGTNLIQGLISGASSMGGALKNTVSNLANGAINSIKGMFGIASPSKVFRQIGVFTGQGLIQGLGSQKNKVSAAITGMAEIPEMPKATIEVDAVARLRGAASGASSAAAPNNVTINFNGLVTDPSAAAAKIRQLLSDYEFNRKVVPANV